MNDALRATTSVDETFELPKEETDITLIHERANCTDFLAILEDLKSGLGARVKYLSLRRHNYVTKQTRKLFINYRVWQANPNSTTKSRLASSYRMYYKKLELKRTGG